MKPLEHRIRIGKRGRYELMYEDKTGVTRIMTSDSEEDLAYEVLCMQQALQAEEDFLNAWKEGVALHPHFFDILTPLELASDKNQLRPKPPEYWDDHIWPLSGGQRIFLAGMMSFFNSSRGQDLLKKLRRENICDIAAGLDSERTEIISKLFINYRGW